VKLGRKARYQQAFKKAKQDKIDRKANVKQAKKRSTSGKRKARQQWQSGSTAALAAERSRREPGSGQNLTAESLKLIAWLHRADRSGPSDIDGNQTSGVVIHNEWLFGGD
jgi:hypothetical protein